MARYSWESSTEAWCVDFGWQENKRELEEMQGTNTMYSLSQDTVRYILSKYAIGPKGRLQGSNATILWQANITLLRVSGLYSSKNPDVLEPIVVSRMDLMQWSLAVEVLFCLSNLLRHLARWVNWYSLTSLWSIAAMVWSLCKPFISRRTAKNVHYKIARLGKLIKAFTPSETVIRLFREFERLSPVENTSGSQPCGYYDIRAMSVYYESIWRLGTKPVKCRGFGPQAKWSG